MSKIETKLQEHLNANVLFSLVHSCFERIKDHIGQKTSKYPRIHTIFYSPHSNCVRLYHRSWLICIVKKCLRNGKETVPRLHAFTTIAGIAVEEAVPDKIILFGSRAKGEQTKEGDCDICVLKKGILHKRKLAQRIYLALDVNAPVDVIVETPERFNELKDNPFLIYSNIVKYGRVVYEK